MSPNHWFASASAVSDLITLQRFLDDRVFVTAEGGYGTTFALDGVDPECLSEQELQATSAQLMQVQRMLPEEAVLQQILVKHRTSDLSTSTYADSADDPVSETQRRRTAFLTTRKLGTIRLFWTVYMAPPKQSGKAPADQIATSKRMLRQLASVAGLVQANLRESFGLRWMDAHEIAQLYGFIASLDKNLSPRKLTATTHVARQLSSCSVHWKQDGLQIGRRQARLFSLLRRPTSTRPHLFGDLLRLDVDLVLVLESQRRSVEKTREAVTSHQTFKDLFRHSLLTVVAHAKGGKEISKSAQTVAADKGVDELGSIIDDIENRGLGYVQFSIIGLLHSSDSGELDDHMAQVHRVLSRSEASLLEEGIGSLSAYCALFPGAAKYGQPLNVRRW